MKRKKHLFRVLIVCLVLFTLNVQAQGTKEKPNVIVILTDDQGFADVGFQNLPASLQVYTPNLDALAASGTVFKNGYSSYAVCGPSRAGLLTGRNPSRFGMEVNDVYVSTDEIIIPRAIEAQGYTSGAFGKWHVGNTPGTLPLDRGFDFYYGDIEKQKDYHMRIVSDPPCWTDGTRSPGENGRYITDAYTDQTITFIEDNKDNPFFAYVAYNAPHSPFLTTRQLLERVVAERPDWAPVYERMKLETRKWNGDNYNLGKYNTPDMDKEIRRLAYISMLLAADDGVGKIIQILDDNNLRENTLIFYLSDNGAGPDNSLGGINLPLRDGKNAVFDGGVRVPFVMSWPGVIEQGVDNNLIVSALDIFATTVELSGGQVPNDRVIDGVNLIPYLTGEQDGQPHEALFWRRSGFHALRSGDFKIWQASASPSLYDIQNEIEEQTNLAKKQPDLVEELVNLYEELIADLPEPLSNDMDGDGIKDISDRCLNTPKRESVDDEGCSASQRL